MTATWRPAGELQQRVYGSYADYCAQQRSKLDRMTPGELATYEAPYLAALRPRLAADGLTRGTSVVCLGARGGAEVQALLSLGCVAIGIDLNPGPANRYVVTGDFHALPYGDGTVGVVFTNALDHCYDFQQVITEVRRVLAVDGRFIVEAVCGTDEGVRVGSYESCAWRTISALVTAVASQGFTVARREPFTCPWPGEHLVFRMEAR